MTKQHLRKFTGLVGIFLICAMVEMDAANLSSGARISAFKPVKKVKAKLNAGSNENTDDADYTKYTKSPEIKPIMTASKLQESISYARERDLALVLEANLIAYAIDYTVTRKMDETNMEMFYCKPGTGELSAAQKRYIDFLVPIVTGEAEEIGEFELKKQWLNKHYPGSALEAADKLFPGFRKFYEENTPERMQFAQFAEEVFRSKMIFGESQKQTQRTSASSSDPGDSKSNAVDEAPTSKVTPEDLARGCKIEDAPENEQ